MTYAHLPGGLFTSKTLFQRIVDRTDDVCSWLAKSNLQRFEEIFENNGYDDLEVIAEINEADLDAMEISLPGHRTKILSRVQQLKEQADHRKLSYFIWFSF